MTNSVVMYRPGPRWSIVIAFVAAATIHLSAVAIAALCYEAPITQTETAFTSVEILGSAPDPSPPSSHSDNFSHHRRIVLETIS